MFQIKLHKALEIIFSFTTLLLCTDSVVGSAGDVDPNYIQCVGQCEAGRCSVNPLSRFGSGFPYWSCWDDCKYDCLHEITKSRAEIGLGPLKYYGHWPFTRLFGLEEPASVIFSVLNGVPYLVAFVHSVTRYGLFSFTRVNVSPDSSLLVHFMHQWLIVYYLIGLNAWIASAFYHSRKTEPASFYDYISALLFLVFTLWIALRRCWGVGAKSYMVTAGFMSFMALYVFQVYRMYLGEVTFGAHMAVCITISVANVLTWILWLIMTPNNGNYRYLCLLTQVWFSVAAMLEIFDFPAIWGLFDAHSLWHAATIPLGFIWWSFWRLDCENGCSVAKQS